MLTVDIKKQLSDFNLDIKFSVENNITVLFGPSGSGKTTILRCIAGLLVPDAGYISANKRVFYSSDNNVFIPPRARNIGYVFQDYALFPHLNVKKNIWYGVKQNNQQANELYQKLVSLLKIEHLSNRYPENLSGGEKQRVALARGLMIEPEIILLDEPMSSLDNETRFELQFELRRIQNLWRIPFILVTHNTDEAIEMGDNIIFMEKGRQVSGSKDWYKAKNVCKGNIKTQGYF